MSQPYLFLKRSFLCSILFAGVSLTGRAQSGSIDFAKDTMSRADATGARSTYLNMIRGSGQSNATELIKLPVQKIKSLMDACAQNNISEVSVMIISLRQQDIARYRRMNPGSAATDDQIRGSQLIVFRIPRRAFSGMANQSGAIMRSHPAVMNLAAAGLALLDFRFADLPPATDDMFFAFGSICPPPTSCD